MRHECGFLGTVRNAAGRDGALDGDQYRRRHVLLLARTMRGICIDRTLRGAGDQSGKRGDAALSGTGLPCARRRLHWSVCVGVCAGVDPLCDVDAQQ